jgi:hypothetical protein
MSDEPHLADARIGAMPTRTNVAQEDRGFLPWRHPIADSGPCAGHRCDDCATCRGGTCCGTLPVKIYRDGNPALSPELHGPAASKQGLGG